jgi:hypothetical protein
MTFGISGGPIEQFREGWAILPFVGRAPHFWRRIQLSNNYLALCGLRGSLASREQLVARGFVHAEGIKPLEPGDFMVDRCKLCSKKRQKVRR